MAAALTSDSTPAELEKIRQRAGTFYPVAYVTMSIVVENYDPDDPPAAKVIHAIPISASIQRNSYKEADTFEVTFDAKDLPLSPENIRSGGVELRIWQTKGLLDESQNITVLATEGVAGGIPPSSIGLIDDVSVDYSERGKTVSISCSDYTQLFISAQYDQRRRVPANTTLGGAILELKDEVDSAARMRLVVEPEGTIFPTLGKSVTKTNKKGRKTSGETYWDVMYKLAVSNGFILFVRGLDLVLTTPRAYIEGQKRRFVMTWGKNLTSLNMSRKLGKVKSPRVLVVSYDDTNREPISAIFPPDVTEEDREATRQAKAGTSPTGRQRRFSAKDEITVLTAPGATGVETLLRAAETAYTLKGRSEQKITVTTGDLRDMRGEDLLDIIAGDAVHVTFEPQAIDILETQTFSQRVATLVRLGYTGRGVPEAIAKAVEDRGVFAKPFRVRESRIEYSIDTGVTISLTLQNFVNLLKQVP